MAKAEGQKKIKALLNYQEADMKLREIELALSGSEERKKALTAKKFLDGVQDNLDKLDLKASELNAAYEKCAEDLKKLKEQESEFTSAAEEAEDMNAIEYLGKKTDELLKSIRTLSATAARIAEEMQTVVKEFAQLKTKAKAAQAQYNESAPKYAELKNSLKADKEAADKQLAELKKEVDPALMERYEKKRKSFYPVVYKAEGDFCGACRYELSGGETSRLKNGEIIECEKCGRLLYSDN